MATEKPLARKVYHGRIVYLINNKQIGLPSISQEVNKCRILFDNSMPF